MNLPQHVGVTESNENEFILTNNITSLNIKIGYKELKFLSFLHNTQGNDIFTLLSEQQKIILKNKFDELGFLSEPKSIKIQEKGNPRNLSTIPLMKLNPTLFLNKVSGFSKVIFSKYFLAFIVLVFLVSFSLTLFKGGDWVNQLSIEEINISTIILTYLMIIIVLIMHELAHALTCHFFGGHVKEIGVMLLYFNPALYCDVSSVYQFKENKKKVFVILAGVISQTFFGSIATIIYFISFEMGYHPDFLLYFVTMNSLILIINLIPLIKLDGYWLVVVLTDISNLRDKGFKYIISLVFPKYRVLRKKLSKSLIIIAYGWLSLIFTSFVWILGIRYLYDIVTGFNEILGTVLLFVVLSIVISHIIYSLIVYLRKMNNDLSLLQ